MTEILIPNIGDAENVEVIELCVAPGDRVGPDDAIIVIESDKASMEVPSGVAGIIEALLVAIGDEVTEGKAIARLQVSVESDDVQEPVPTPTATLSPSDAAATEEVSETASDTVSDALIDTVSDALKEVMSLAKKLAIY